MSTSGESGRGLWASVKRMGDTVLSMVQNRVELFAVELQEEKCRLVEAILCAAAVAAFGMMTLTLVTITVVVLFWENGRLAALVGLSGFYLLVTAWAWRELQKRLKSGSAFAGTLGELKKDRSSTAEEN